MTAIQRRATAASTGWVVRRDDLVCDCTSHFFNGGGSADVRWRVAVSRGGVSSPIDSLSPKCDLPTGRLHLPLCIGRHPVQRWWDWGATWKSGRK